MDSLTPVQSTHSVFNTQNQGQLLSFALGCRLKTAITRPTYRRGWVLAAVMEVLAAASGPMQTQAIHAAVERLAGESIASSSVRSCLVENLGGKTPRFERVGHGRYRLAPRFERVE